MVEQCGHALNECVGPPQALAQAAQDDAIQAILSQRNAETDLQQLTLDNPR